MANARLKMARQGGRRRARERPGPEEAAVAEAPAQQAAETDACKPSNESAMSTDEVVEEVKSALRERKAAVEARLEQLTMGKTLTASQEPGRDADGHRVRRAHRDFLLQEMEWMAADFAQERKWRVKSARMLATSLASYHKNQENRAAKQLKEEELARRRLAARIGRDIKKFWAKVDKIISYKVKLQSDEIRKAAMDRHLKQLVAQTERYSSALATSLAQSALSGSDGENDDEEAGPTSGSAAAPTAGDSVPIADSTSSDSDYAMASSEGEVDDEATIAAEESLAARDRDHDNELSLLEREANMSIEELRAHYALVNGNEDLDDADAASSDGNDHAADPLRNEESSSGDDFRLSEVEDGQDDETTIALDEAHISRDEVDEEVRMLHHESEMSVEELRAMYANALASGGEEDVEEDEAQPEESEGASGDESGDEEFRLTHEEVDDESTLEEEERRHVSRDNVDDEVANLLDESEMPIEQLRTRYARALNGSDASDAEDEKEEEDTTGGAVTANDHDSADDEFEPMEDEADDETTIEEEERRHFSRSEVDDEVANLVDESEMSIEELRARYAGAFAETSEASDIAMTDDAGVDNTEEEEKRDSVLPTEPSAEGNMQANDSKSSANKSTQPAPATARRVGGGYKRPYILTSRLSLREYQEAGVNWLISMCEKRINGILADEMGLGKTIQTITMLAHLACTRGLWGPHLIVVPTSCLVNWEMEFKRWCPAFKVLTYFGSAKRRKELRQGWSKQNAFQICITSYQIVVQDAHCFKRKKWYYLILDEAHNIKNWKSLRWQTLLNFSSQRRLLLTGTPLQNNIMELWALMHFLMPHVFASRKEFTYWFQNPLAQMVEGEQDVNNQLVSQLHGIIRPFVLRRLKKDVAKQMPGKFEHVIQCKLSKRQRFLYEDFISRSSTRRAMFGRGNGRGANFMSMMNVLMQLRKVCNHPDLFEPRPIAAPFDMEPIRCSVPMRCGFLLDELVNERPGVALWSDAGSLVNLELVGHTKYAASRRRQLFFYDVNACGPVPGTSTPENRREMHKDLLIRLAKLNAQRRAYWSQKRKHNGQLGRLRVELVEDPVYGDDLIRCCTLPVFISHAMDVHVKRKQNRARDLAVITDAIQVMVRSPEDRIEELLPVVSRAVCYVPKARAGVARIEYEGTGFAESLETDSSSDSEWRDRRPAFALSRRARLGKFIKEVAEPVASKLLAPFHESFKRTQLFFPDKRLIQFDCGKLQQLDVLLRELKRGNHRCLIFTQMSSMLNILEIFLNIHGHTYFRLDGSTKVEKRQALMEKFNRDEKIFCFILSTRSGGLGINLTGADCVIFYDSDWNPAMDAQAQDRAHRIGQTRDVHIYRLVSEHTVEENILRKAQQKRHLDFLVMAEGQFTTDFFSKSSLRELVTGVSTSTDDAADDRFSPVEEVDDEQVLIESEPEEELSFDTVENAMTQLEDEDDVVAMKGAKAEVLSEQREFDEDGGGPQSGVRKANRLIHESRPSTPSSASVVSSVSERDDEDADEGEDEGAGEPTLANTDAQHTDEDETQTATDDGDDPDDGESEDEGSGLSGDSSESDDGDGRDGEEHSSRKRKRPAPSRSTSSRKAIQRTSRKRQRQQQDQSEKERARAERAKEKARERQMELEEEKKLQAWKDSVSSLKGFEDSLNPVDRYALHFREDIDPLYSYVPTAAALESHYDAQNGVLVDIERIEAEKAAEEAVLIADGELIAGVIEDTDGDHIVASSQAIYTSVVDEYAKLYKKERAHVHFERRRRLLTGAAWQIMKCAKTNHPFYYNVDTREAIWDRPAVLIKNEQLEQAASQGYAGLMPSVLTAVMKFLAPYPDRQRVQLVCKSWQQAATHPSIFMRLNASDIESDRQSLSKILEEMPHGDTVLFSSGVYCIDEPIEIRKPIQLLAAHDSHVELQMCSASAQLRWTAHGGLVRGFHFSRRDDRDDSSAIVPVVNAKSEKQEERRRAVCWQHLLNVVDGGRVRVQYCDFDGNNSGNACAAVSGVKSLLVMQNNRIYSAGSSGVLQHSGGLVMSLNTIYENRHSGVSILGGDAVLRRNKIHRNGRFGIRLVYHANNVVVEENIVNDHPCGNIDTENSGRRFVIRWNDMSKDEPDDLPHHHGMLRLRTPKIVNKVLPATPSKTATPKMMQPPVVKSETQSASNSATVAATAVTFNQQVSSVPHVAVSVPTPIVPVAGQASLLSPGFVLRPPLNLVAAASTTSIQSLVAPIGGQPKSSQPFAVPSVAPQVSSQIAIPTVAGVTAPSTSAAVPGLLSTPSMTLNHLGFTSVAALPVTGTAFSTSSSISMPLTATATPNQPKKRRKRQKIVQELVNGHVIVFKDTCEKRGEKVKKPRTTKAPAVSNGPDPTATSNSVDQPSDGAAVVGSTAAFPSGKLESAVPVNVKDGLVKTGIDSESALSLQEAEGKSSEDRSIALKASSQEGTTN